MLLRLLSPPSDPTVTSILGNPGSSQHMLYLLLVGAWVSFSMCSLGKEEREKMNLWAQDYDVICNQSFVYWKPLLRFAKGVSLYVPTTCYRGCVTGCRVAQEADRWFVANTKYTMGLHSLLCPAQASPTCRQAPCSPAPDFCPSVSVTPFITPTLFMTLLLPWFPHLWCMILFPRVLPWYLIASSAFITFFCFVIP